MKGFNLTKNQQPLAVASLDTSSLSLLARSSKFEVMEQYIKKDKMFVIYPSECTETIEFFYVLEGEIYFDDDKIFISKGDSFYLQSLKSSANFKAHTDVKILYFTNELVFESLSDEILALKEIMSKINFKDQYTKSHCDRVQEYSFQIAKQLGLKGDILEAIQFASVFHDLGKLEIPDEILNKPGKLTDEEYEIIKTHSFHGSQIIKTLYFKNLEQIVLQHHERVDGTGYPMGLKGDEIMLEASIITVADTYDAMTSDRPYRKALPVSEAINELIRYRGTHFKEEVVDAFLVVLQNSKCKLD